MSVCMRAYPWMSEVLHPLELELQAVESHPMWVLGTNLGPLQERYAFLTTEPFEPSLQPLSLAFAYS